jgi:hypothetical protein
VECPGAEPVQRQLCQLDVQGARLRFGEDGADIAGRDLALRKDPGKQVDPLSLQTVGEHGGAIVIESAA